METMYSVCSIFIEIAVYLKMCGCVYRGVTVCPWTCDSVFKCYCVFIKMGQCIHRGVTTYL